MINRRRPVRCRRRSLVALAACLALVSLAVGCDDDTPAGPLRIEYWDADTTPAPDRVRLEGVSRAERTLTVRVVVDGPTTSDDLRTFDFGVRIGDESIAEWVAGSESLGDALDTTGCADAVVFATRRPGEGVAVSVATIGCPSGNRVLATGATLMTFDVRVLRDGATSVALGAVPRNDPPVALDSNAAPVPSIEFDPAAIVVFGL